MDGGGDGLAQDLRRLVFQISAVDEVLLDALLKHEGPMIPAACYRFCSKGLPRSKPQSRQPGARASHRL